MTRDEQEQVRSEIADMCVAIEGMFMAPCQVTVVVRMPSLKDGGVLVTNDEPQAAAAEILRLSQKPLIGQEQK